MTTPSPTHDRSTDAAVLRTDTLADSVLILLALTAVQRGVGFCRAVLFCRWLDVEQLGEWDMAFSFLMLAAPLSVLALSGSFGRYVEHYRHKQQLRTLLRRTAVLVACLAALSAALIYLTQGWFAQLIFGSSAKTPLVALLVGSLLATIAFHYFVDLFTALRKARLIAGLQLVNSLAFATLGICLLLYWQTSAASVVIAYGGACAISTASAIWWLRRAWPAMPQAAEPLGHRGLWSKLIPFAAWIWVTSLLVNLFEIVDRYMIIHSPSLAEAEALVCVGNYHSSRVVPMLLVSIALLLGTIITPHLSHDWESGRRHRVAARLNLFLKLIGFALVAAAVVMMFAAPLLFGVAFRGKFAAGLNVLPWTLTYCVWFGLACIAQNYMWCREKAYLASLALVLGLGVNIGLNLLLLPRLGLLGAVLATTAANLVALVLIFWFNHLLGFRIDRGTRLVMALPPVVCLGPWIAAAVLVAVALEAVTTDRLLDREEKRQLADGWAEYLQRFRNLRAATGPAAPR